MVRSGSRRFDTWTKIWLGLAALWSLGLIAAGFLVTSYSSTNGPGLTLIQENGLKVLYVLLIPFAGVGSVTLALWRRQRTPKPGAGVLAWVVVSLLGVVTVLGALSVGP